MRINLTNPFLLPTHSGVRYYDTTTLDGGHFLTMITNAREFSAFLLSQLKRDNSLPAYNKIMATEWKHEGIVANRQSYLKSNIEPLMRELYQDKHEALLPAYIASKPEPIKTTDAEGKPLKRKGSMVLFLRGRTWMKSIPQCGDILPTAKNRTKP